MDELARSAAAAGMKGGGAGPAMDDAPVEPMPGEEELGIPAAPDLEGALAGVEEALAGMDPGIAEEARTHLNAIRELAASDVGPSEELPPEGAPEEALESGGGMPGGESMPSEMPPV